MDNFEEYGKQTKEMRHRLDTFFQQETTAKERQQILKEAQASPGLVANALFTLIGHPYEFQLNGTPYTLEYNSTYYLNAFRAEYQLNLYSGQGEDKQLLKQERDKSKSQMYTRFMKLVDAIKNGNFDPNNY